MGKMEVRAVTPNEIIQELEEFINRSREDKYAFQVGLKDLDFDVREDLIQAMGLPLPFSSIGQAEQALRARAIQPTIFWEHDETQHQVLVFDPRPVGFSGFMDCVMHSLALTDQGLFEVGRYPAVSLSEQNRYWGWFLHRRLISPDQAAAWQEEQSLTSEQFVEQVYTAMIKS